MATREFIYLTNAAPEWGGETDSTGTYKVGKTDDLSELMEMRPFKSRLVRYREVSDGEAAENCIIHYFTETFGDPVRGKDHFFGNVNEMRQVLDKVYMFYHAPENGIVNIAFRKKRDAELHRWEPPPKPSANQSRLKSPKSRRRQSE
jgi:hypothetical protein